MDADAVEPQRLPALDGVEGIAEAVPHTCGGNHDDHGVVVVNQLLYREPARLGLQRPEVALVDLDLPGMSGSELVSYLIQKAPPIQTVLVTAACEERVSNLTEGTGVGYLRKPIDFNDLLRKLDKKPAPN